MSSSVTGVGVVTAGINLCDGTQGFFVFFGFGVTVSTLYNILHILQQLKQLAFILNSEKSIYQLFKDLGFDNTFCDFLKQKFMRFAIRGT